MYKTLMFKKYQNTIIKPIAFEGIGLHSGKISKVKLLPGVENQGVIFKRVDIKQNNLIEANFKNVSSSKLCTTLENDSGLKVSTIEHLLAAFYMAEVDNVIVEINNEEVPIMDGSSKNFIELINNTGIKKQTEKRKYLKIIDNCSLKDGEKSISIEPTEDQSLQVNFKLDYDNKVIGKQENQVNFSNKDLTDIYSSRTFCLLKDIEKIKKSGLAKGGSLDNAIVVDEDKIVNKNGLRNKKEFVNHKILDLAGDFMLSGYRILGKVKCNQGGHHFSNSFLRKLLKTKNVFVETDLSNIGATEKVRDNLTVKIAVNA